MGLLLSCLIIILLFPILSQQLSCPVGDGANPDGSVQIQGVTYSAEELLRLAIPIPRYFDYTHRRNANDLTDENEDPDGQLQDLSENIIVNEKAGKGLSNGFFENSPSVEEEGTLASESIALAEPNPVTVTSTSVITTKVKVFVSTFIPKVKTVSVFATNTLTSLRYIQTTVTLNHVTTLSIQEVSKNRLSLISTIFETSFVTKTINSVDRDSVTVSFTKILEPSLIFPKRRQKRRVEDSAKANTHVNIIEGRARNATSLHAFDNGVLVQSITNEKLAYHEEDHLMPPDYVIQEFQHEKPYDPLKRRTKAKLIFLFPETNLKHKENWQLPNDNQPQQHYNTAAKFDKTTILGLDIPLFESHIEQKQGFTHPTHGYLKAPDSKKLNEAINSDNAEENDYENSSSNIRLKGLNEDEIGQESVARIINQEGSAMNLNIAFSLVAISFIITFGLLFY